MSCSLRVLFVEDCDDDLLLLLRELRKGEYAIAPQQVKTKAAYQQALHAQTWDLILSDYALPDFTAADALQILRTRGLDIPFIVISGAVGEATAVRLMKAGAHDFFVKGNLKRLLPAIERERREAENRRAKQQAETALHRAFDELEQLVAQRTAELVKTNQQLICEIEERRRAENRIQLQYTIAQILAEAQTIPEATPLVLQALGETFDCAWGELRVKDPQTGLLRLAGRWEPRPNGWDSRSQTLPIADSAAQHWNLQPIDYLDAPKSVGSSSPIPDWPCPNGPTEPSPHSLHPMQRFLILDEQGETIGRLDLWSQSPQWLDANLDKLMVTISRQLGQFIQRQQAEAALAQLAAIVESSEDAIISTTLDGRVLSWNHGAERLYGYSSMEAKGQRLVDLIQPDSERWLRVLQGEPWAGKVDQHQAVHCRKDHELVDVFMTVSLIRDKQNYVSGLSMIARDIRDRRALDRLKDEFISIVSHELRTPLAALQAAVELLLSHKLGNLSHRGQRLLQIAADNTDRLVKLTNDILELETLMSGKAVLAKRHCNIRELLLQAVHLAQAPATQANINLITRPTSTQSIWADPDRLIQVLVKLLANAIKFSPPGSTVWLSAEPYTAPSPKHSMLALPQILISVKDQGQGIPADKLDAIFKHFHQLNASDSRQQGGAGLGLALCRSIVHQHQGSIWVESIVGQGSTFYITLPVGISMIPEKTGNTESNHSVEITHGA